MRLLCRLAAGLALWAALAPHVWAANPPAPLRLIPDQADLLVEIKQPRQLVEGFVGLDLLKQLQTFSLVREQLDSTTTRKFYQLVAYFEKELGAKWPELLDKLAGGGLALGVKLGDQAPALLVVQGVDEKLTAKFAETALGIIEQELARQEVKAKPVRGKYNDIETVRLGDGFHLAAVGSALLIANKEEALHKALDLAAGKAKASMADVAEVAEAAKLLPRHSAATLWLNMETARKNPGAEAAYKTPRDPFLAIVLGSYLDSLGRTPYLCAGLAAEKNGLVLSFRTPAGRDGAGVEKTLHMPPDGQPGSRPLLEPKGVLLSESFYMDLKAVWNDRTKFLSEDRVKAFEEFDKNSPRFLSGTQLSELFSTAGPYHRIVVAHQPKVGYTVTPKQPIPAFAFVSELREPEAFARAIEPTLRGAAFLASTQVKLKMSESNHNDCKIVAWRFPEDAPFKIDVNDVRFNFSPCFTRVGNQFVVCSTVELCQELIDLLQKEQKDGAKSDNATSRIRFYSAGVADILSGIEDQLTTQAVLDQALTAEDARKQVKTFIRLLRSLGSLGLEADFQAKELHYDLRVRLDKGVQSSK